MATDETDRKKRARAEDKQSLGEPGAVAGQGRGGGRLAKEIGTEDELKRAFERPAGKTRVTKQDEQD